MKVAFIVPDLSENPIGRTHELAKALEPFHEITMAGYIDHRGLYPPYASEWTYITEPLTGYPGAAFSAARLFKRIDAQVVIASKARPLSLGAALEYRRRTGALVFVDVDDWELGGELDRPWWSFLGRCLDLRRNTHPWRLHQMETACRSGVPDGVFCVSSFLQKRLGGEILPHAVDAAMFDPARFDRAELRRKYGLPADEFLLIFTGAVRKHKGIAQLLEALDALPPHVKLLAVTHALPDDLARRHAHRLHLMGYQPRGKLPELLALADTCALPQQPTNFAAAQMPAKLPEAMAAALPVIAAKLADIPEVLGGGGLIVDTDPASLARAVRSLAESPELRLKLGNEGRKRVLENYTLEHMRRRLEAAFERGFEARSRRNLTP